MKTKIMIIAVAALLGGTLTGCKKCSECHYDGVGGEEVELGEYCDDELEDLEANGHHDHNADTTYEVHCHEH